MTTVAGITTLQGRSAEPIDVSAVEREMAAMWRSAAKPGEKPVMRACRTNLVGIGEPEVPELIEEVLSRHPARLIIVAPAEEAERGAAALSPPAPPPISAHVSAACHWRQGGVGLVCSERITIRVGKGAEVRVPSAVRSLASGNRPVVVIGAADQVARYAEFGLLTAADRVIIDSTGADIDAWLQVSSHRPPDSDAITDLGWIRLRPFRAAVAQAILRSPLRRSLSQVDAVDIAHAGAPTAALLLAGWIAERLRWGRFRRIASSRKPDARAGKIAAGVAGDIDQGVIAFEFGGRSRRQSRLRVGPASEGGEALVILLRSPESELRVALSVAEARAVIQSAPGRARISRAPSRGRRRRGGGAPRLPRGGVRRERIPVDVISPADAIVGALGHDGLCDPTAPVALARALEMAAALAASDES
jgi:glucose-6-phosphate dehydrogenase assembly protein OpcA